MNPLLFPHIDFNSILNPNGKVFVIFIPFQKSTKEGRMRYFPLFCIGLLCSAISWAQTDLGTTRPLNIKSNNTLDYKTSDQGTSLKIPSMMDPKKSSPNLRDSLTARNVKMLPDRELVDAGRDLKLDPKIYPKEKEGDKNYYGDMYLGDVKSNGKFVGVVCRDHEFVDNDRVRIYLNGEVVDPDLLLSGVFKGINADLKPGFNRLEFEALNQGSSGPNTAQVNIYDDKGILIMSNKWNLSTGAKATIIVVKEEGE